MTAVWPVAPPPCDTVPFAVAGEQNPVLFLSTCSIVHELHISDDSLMIMISASRPHEQVTTWWRVLSAAGALDDTQHASGARHVASFGHV
jgi:hypothetical protein